MDYLYEALVKRQNELLELVHLLSSKVHVDQIENEKVLKIEGQSGNFGKNCRSDQRYL